MKKLPFSGEKAGKKRKKIFWEEGEYGITYKGRECVSQEEPGRIWNRNKPRNGWPRL